MTVAARQTELAEAIRELAERIVQTDPTLLRDNRIVRYEVPIAPVDPLAWLNGQPEGEMCYWRSRDGDFESAGIGRADRMSEPTKATALPSTKDGHTPPVTPARYLGGRRFDPDYPESKRSPEWSSFADRSLILPRFEIVKAGDGCYLTVNLVDPGEDLRCLAEEAKLISSPVPLKGLHVRPTNKKYVPGRDAWQESVRLALQSIRSNQIRKLVLARQTRLTFDSAPGPWQLLAGLRGGTRNCFLFGFSSDRGATFLGASPERLYRRYEDAIVTEAIAGTRPRGDSRDNDIQLAAELTSSQKERWEQRLVVSGLEADLGEVCEQVLVSDLTGPMKLARLQHLATRLEGRLKPGLDDEAITIALHPSPAVGGYPTGEARTHIRKLEPFDRGWYAAPVGWISNGSAEFAVGIRSGLLVKNELHLYSGAGIVEGSEPEAEWDEVESKIGPFLHLLSDRVNG